jgi:hypothetical protein
MKTGEVKARLYRMLNARKGGYRTWDRDAIQQAIEPTCLTILALRHDWTKELEVAVRSIVASQNSDGSFPVFIGDESEGCWTTGLAVLSLLAIGRETARLQPAIRWILGAKGREANWFWRWKFQTVDHSVQFDPAKYGWSWVPDAMPTCRYRSSPTAGTHFPDRRFRPILVWIVSGLRPQQSPK